MTANQYKKRIKKAVATIIWAWCIGLVLFGCSAGENGAKSSPGEDGTVNTENTAKTENLPDAPPQPVTVKVLWPGSGYLTEEEFNRFVVAPVRAKHPHIEVERIDSGISIAAFEKMLLQEVYPDIIITSDGIMDPLRASGFISDIEPLIRESGLDLNRLKPEALQAVRIAGGENYLVALPYTENLSALFYNRELFARFGTDAPRDGLYWDETVELAKRLTNNIDGIQYYGLHPGLSHRSASQLSLSYVEPQTMKAVLNTAMWKTAIKNLQSIFAIPGNSYVGESAAVQNFRQHKTLAMFAANNRLNEFSQVADLNWNIAAYPAHREAPGRGIQYNSHVMAITTASKQRTAAMQLLTVMLSDEVQLLLARNGRISVLKDDRFREQFGADLAYMNDKNTAAIFRTAPAAPYPPTLFDATARNMINNDVSVSVFQRGVDINTALREAEEKLNQHIQTELSKR